MRNLLCLAAVVLGRSRRSGGRPSRRRGPRPPTCRRTRRMSRRSSTRTARRATGRGNRADVAADVRDVRPHARDIRDKVAEGTMPPWHADMPPGTFLNERSLTAAEKSTILRWAPTARRRATRKTCRRRPQYPTAGRSARRTSSWKCRRTTRSRPTARSQYEYFYIPTNFTEPKWVQAIEVRPGNREVVHHVLVYYQVRPDLQRTPVLKFNAEQQRIPPRRARVRIRHPRQRAGASHRDVRARHESAGVPAGHGDSARARRRHRAADALHDDRGGGDRSDAGSA